MKYSIIVLVLSFNLVYSQETYTNTHDSIYIESGLFYKVRDHQLYTGDINFIKKNGVIVTKEIYKDGYLTNEYSYYNKSSRGNICEERVFYLEKIDTHDSRFKTQKIIRYHTTGEIYNIKYFNTVGDKIKVEEFENGRLVYSCEYKNGKKNGKEFGSTKKCGDVTVTYLNGKKID